jgi:uroporphyrinogen III methyltransferase/synthase
MTVYLVGAGPGDPGLFTVRGAELLARADVVVHDRLGTAALLSLCRSDALLIDVGKAPKRAAMNQEQINATLVEYGRTAGCVVRLKGGDPFVFGRGGEEAEALIAAGIPFEEVPGVTSAIAAPAYAGIPVTHRGVSTHVTIVTGHEDPTKGRTDTDWDALARAGGTIVVLMGAGNLEGICTALIAGGRAPSTPLAAVRWGTTPAQRTIRTTLAAAPSAGIEAPSAIVIGDVAALDFGWFERRPLFGRRIVITRAREQASALGARLIALGAEVIELPSIRLEDVPFRVPPLEGYAWIVFTSANGVERFLGAALAGRDARALGGVRVAAIGPGTADALGRFGVRPDLVPERFIAESLLDAFPAPDAPGARVLIARAETARDVLPEGLAALGYEVEVLPVYRTVTATPDPDALAAARAGEFDAITFTSSSTVTNFHAIVGAVPPGTQVISIGPVTSATARDLGYTITAEADPHDIDGLVAATVDALHG